jgi:hypothetical protein
MAEITITNEQKQPFSVLPVTESGKEATLLDGAIRLSVISGEGAFVVGGDGLSGELISSDTPGDTTYLLEADADIGEGVELIQETITMHVSGAQAKSFGLMFGDPVSKY